MRKQNQRFPYFKRMQELRGVQELSHYFPLKIVSGLEHNFQYNENYVHVRAKFSVGKMGQGSQKARRFCI